MHQTTVPIKGSGANVLPGTVPGHPAADQLGAVKPRASGDHARIHKRDQEQLQTPSLDWARVRELAMRQLDRFLSLEPKVLRGNDADAIHDMRVASRRLQQVLDVLYPPPPPGEIRRLRRKMRRARRALSAVRDCDVQLARVEKSLAGKRTSRRETWEAIKDYLIRRRASAFERALRKLTKLNLATFYVRLKGHLELNGSVAGSDHHVAEDAFALPDQRAPEKLRERLGQSLEELWQTYEVRASDSQRDGSQPALHGARIAAKRLRYLVEVLHELDVAGSAEVLAWLRTLQQHLGDWHDIEVLEQMLIEMVARPKFLRQHLEVAVAVEKIIQRNRKLKNHYAGKYFRIMQDPGRSERIKEWVAAFESKSPAQALG